MPSFSAAQIERFKREAKVLRRTSPLSHSEALDRIAEANGFPNWSLLMKHSDADDGPVASRSRRARPPHRFLRTPEQMRLALRKVPDPRGLYGPTRADSAQAFVEDLTQSFASALNVVDFAIEYMTCLLAVPRLKIYSTTTVYWEMRSWLPYFFQEVEDDRQIVVNRSYKPAGQVGKDWANYKEFDHLQVRLPSDHLKCFTAPGSKEGYLFNDGCTPWASRADAEAYLERLRILRSVLVR